MFVSDRRRRTEMEENMEEKLDEIIKLLKGIDEKLEVLVNQKVPKSNNSNKAILLKQYEETEKLFNKVMNKK